MGRHFQCTTAIAELWPRACRAMGYSVQLFAEGASHWIWDVPRHGLAGADRDLGGVVEHGGPPCIVQFKRLGKTGAVEGRITRGTQAPEGFAQMKVLRQLERMFIASGARARCFDKLLFGCGREHLLAWRDRLVPAWGETAVAIHSASNPLNACWSLTIATGPYIFATGAAIDPRTREDIGFVSLNYRVNRLLGRRTTARRVKELVSHLLGAGCHLLWRRHSWPLLTDYDWTVDIDRE